MTQLFSNYGRKSYEIISGHDATLIDNMGNEYLDFTSGIGVMNLGYGNADVQEALKHQADILWHMPNLYESQLQEEVAAQLTGDYDYLAFFCNSGAEANEAAIKLARKATGKSQIISFTNSFHGRTYGAMSATGQDSIHAGYEPLVPDFTYVPYNDAEAFRHVMKQSTAAVMLELIQGEGGVLPADKTWLQQVVACCQENDVLIIVDEVQTGIGRTGTLYAFEQFGFVPDIVTLAKGLGNGIPVGAMLGKRQLGTAFGPGSHGSTFGGNKLAMSVAKSVLSQIKDETLLNDVQKKGQWLQETLEQLPKTKVKAVRGMGLMIGIELHEAYSVVDSLQQLEQTGVLALRAGQNVLRLLPPLTISWDQLKTGTEKIYACLKD